MFQNGMLDAVRCIEGKEGVGIRLNYMKFTVETEGNNIHMMILALCHLFCTAGHTLSKSRLFINYDYLLTYFNSSYRYYLMSVLSNSIRLGIFFMLLFTSYTSFSTIISQLYKQQGYSNLGKYSIFTNYGFFMISNIFAPYIGTKINSKWLMLFAGCCYSFNYFTGFIITFVV